MVRTGILRKSSLYAIAARRAADVKEERHDLFSSLLDANEGLAATGEKLPDAGLMGNVFIFMVAGAFFCLNVLFLPHGLADRRVWGPWQCRLRGTFVGFSGFD